MTPMASVEIHLKTLTPLWTGGVDGTMDRIHETGILGSLRWWYEAIVRGLGGSACDPSEHTCPDKDRRYCDACAVFGATGLKRSFRLEGPVGWNDRPQNRLTVKVNDNRGWYLGRGWMGAEKIRVVPLRLSFEDVQNTLLLTLRLIECWGGLGPKTQVGYGVVKFILPNGELNVEGAIQAFQRLINRCNRRTLSTHNQWPALNGFFFAKVQFTLNTNTTPEQWIRERVTNNIESNEELSWYLNEAGDAQRKAVLPLSPIVRYHLRTLIRQNIQHNGHPNAPARWQLMGVLSGYWHREDYGKVEKTNRKWQCQHCGRTWSNPPSQWVEKIERRGSLIQVSHAYLVNDGQWEFRIWGWIPGELSGSVSRDDVFQHLRQWLGVQQQRQWHQPQNGALWSALNLTPTQVCWFERRDNERGEDYLRALLEGCEQTSHGGTGNTEN